MKRKYRFAAIPASVSILCFVLSGWGCGSSKGFSQQKTAAQIGATSSSSPTGGNSAGDSSGNNGSNDESGQTASSGKGPGETGTPPSPAPNIACNDVTSCSCGDDKIWICHIPPGNPAAKHTICVSTEGATHGHGVTFDGKPGGHGGDYPGSCKD